jgi:tripeptidyl-peptidase I
MGMSSLYPYLLIACLWLGVFILAVASSILREQSDHVNRLDFIRTRRAYEAHQHSFIIAVKQQNLDRIESLLYQVSDVQSSRYGQHLTFTQVGEIVANPQATAAVSSWLTENHVTIKTQSTYGEYLTCEASISVLEELFETEFYEFEVSANYPLHETRTKVIRATSYSIPEYLDEHIHAIYRVVSVPPPITYRPVISRMPSSSRDTSLMEVKNFPNFSAYAYPYSLRTAYHVTDVGSDLTNQTIFGSLEQTFLPSDLAAFQSKFGLPDMPVAAYYGDVPDNSICNSDSAIENCGEASLDVQYIAAIANEVPTTYFYNPPSDSDLLGFLTTVASFENPTSVYSISYGTYEIFLSNREIASFNTEAMKLGLRGVTIIAASGDDGVAGYLFRSQFSIIECGYFANFPASSPYVTAVGGTMFGLSTGKPEITCSAAQGSQITSGGGFSNSISAPSFQQTAINRYFSGLTNRPKQSLYQPYDRSKRGYPDLSLAADQYGTLY